MSDLAIQANALIKNYGSVRALDNLNWEHLLALLGIALVFTLLA
jgi:hypothetical protein